MRKLNYDHVIEKKMEARIRITAESLLQYFLIALISVNTVYIGKTTDHLSYCRVFA
jgi:hypothetical protein